MQHKNTKLLREEEENKITKDCLQDTYLKIESFIFNFKMFGQMIEIVKWLIMDTNNNGKELLKCSTLKKLRTIN